MTMTTSITGKDDKPVAPMQCLWADEVILAHPAGDITMAHLPPLAVPREQCDRCPLGDHKHLRSGNRGGCSKVAVHARHERLWRWCRRGFLFRNRLATFASHCGLLR